MAVDEWVLSGFRRFADPGADSPSPVYAALAGQVARSLVEGGASARVLEAAPHRQRIPNLLFAAVQSVLFDEPGDPLAEYYPSLGGARRPDARLGAVFEDFVARHRGRIESVLAVGETQTNEVLRAAQLLPALGWAQACTRRPLGLIEVGTSAGLLLHADRYAYIYEFDDGSQLAAGGGVADGVPPLRCRVRGEGADRALEPFVGKEIRISSRVGLDLNPLDPADPAARAWLEALVWPEHAERRSRLVAALDHAARRPVRLRRGDALRILPDAVEGVAANAIPCVFVSNSLPHWSPEGRGQFVALIRELGARRDLVCVLKEAYEVGLGLFTGGAPDSPAAGAGPREVLAAAVYLGGRERLFRLGSAGRHGADLEWAPLPVAA